MFFAVNLITLLGALNVYAVLSTQEFIQRIYLFRGVKLALLLPAVASIFILFKLQELRDLLNREIKVKHVVYACAVLALFGILLVRSGNVSFLPASSAEGYVRSSIEQFFGIRPRLKEFLFGQPLLYIGIWLWLMKSGPQRRPSALAKACLVFSLIGQASVVNTFTHIHTPILVSLLRTLYGCALGFLIGLAVIFLTTSFKLGIPASSGK